jgi:hypothetical protein
MTDSNIQSDVSGLKADVSGLKTEFVELRARQERMEDMIKKHRRDSMAMLVMMRGRSASSTSA